MIFQVPLGIELNKRQHSPCQQIHFQLLSYFGTIPELDLTDYTIDKYVTVFYTETKQASYCDEKTKENQRKKKKEKKNPSKTSGYRGSCHLRKFKIAVLEKKKKEKKSYCLIAWLWLCMSPAFAFMLEMSFPSFL